MFTSLRYMNILVPILTASLAFAALAFGMSSLTESRYPNGLTPNINVEGTHKITVKPDIATFTFTIHAEETTQQAAQTKVAEREKAILDYLKEQSIDDKDIKTGNYDLSPQYEYQVDTNCHTSYCPGKQIQTGYQVSQSVTVKVRVLDKAGELVAGVGARGAENVSQLTFGVDDLAKMKEEAIAAAVENAHEKAEARADALGVRLGHVMGFYEVNNTPYPYSEGMAMSAKAADATPQLPAGENEYTVTVSVQYFIH